MSSLIKCIVLGYLFFAFGFETLAQTPNAKFTKSHRFICLSQGVELNATQSIDSDSFKWTISGEGEDYIFTGNIFTFKPEKPGAYRVELQTFSGAESSQIVVDSVGFFKMPKAFAGDYDSVCLNSAPFTLQGDHSESIRYPFLKGSWFLNDFLLNSGMPYPGKLGVGKHELVYEVTMEGTECSARDTTSLTINPLPSPQILNPWPAGDRFCFIDQNPAKLEGNISENGEAYLSVQWQGTGVEDDGSGNYTFTPLLANAGVHTLEYEVQNKFGCISAVELTADVKMPLMPEFSRVVNGKEVSFTDITEGAETWGWDFGDGSTSTEQNPVHTYADEKEYEVTLAVSSTLNPCGESATKTTIETWPTGREELPESLSFFPNPVNDVLQLQLDQHLLTGTYFKVYSQTGRLVKTDFLSSNSINISGLETGVYVLLLEAHGTILTTQFVKD